MQCCGVTVLRSCLFLASVGLAFADLASAADPLPSWNDGPAKRAILDFIARTTKAGGGDFVAPPDRIAAFDNDGTLWTEQPVYFQLEFAFHRVRKLASEHPEWKMQQPFRAILENDKQGMAAIGARGMVELVTATHGGLTTDEFSGIVADWLATARHARFDRRYDELVYQPMLEMLAYLRENGFKTFIVSGGGIDFMRVFTERIYGIPPEQVVGSSIKMQFEMRDGRPVLVRLPELDFVNDKGNKAVAIEKFIGRRPIITFGNSDGDMEMLQWTTAGAGPRLGLIVHHTDAAREWAYDRQSPVGRLDKGLDQAPERGWIVVNMQTKWKSMYPFETKGR